MTPRTPHTGKLDVHSSSVSACSTTSTACMHSNDHARIAGSMCSCSSTRSNAGAEERACRDPRSVTTVRTRATAQATVQDAGADAL